ncbi:uncharacterized protein LOC123319742 [Coccinella septempunctata]|uniref:uncharacterized protein LOC123319742 n=1 Tax=Coccinella septempunctata TaxID=41139 RepID=UPI001D096154|nr:uncharacterized protein LOC123319742 [Coccinella septempunctata]
MVDFQKICAYLPKDVYRETRFYRTSKRFVRDVETAPVREEKQINVHSTAASCEEDCFCVNQKLARRRRRALLDLESLTMQKKELLDREDDFQQRFIEFNELIIQNDQKKERAATRLEEFRSYVKEQKVKIKDMLHKVMEYRMLKDKLIKEIGKHRIYEEYIESALYEFGRKATVDDAITRYRSLESKKRFLMSRNVAMNSKIKETYEKTLIIMEDKCQKIMHMKGHISRIVLRYGEAVKRTSELECLIASLKDFCAIRLEDLVLSVQGIKNLNEFMRTRRSLQKISIEHYKGQSDDMAMVFHQIVDIKDTMRYMANILENLEMRSKVVRKLWRKGGHTVAVL